MIINKLKMKKIYLDNAGKLSWKESLNKEIPFPRKGKPKSKHYQQIKNEKNIS